MRSTRSRTGRRWRYGTAAVAVLTLGVVSACTNSSSSSTAASGSSSSASAAGSSAASSGSTLSFPRSQTLYTSGTAYGPPVNWNPLDTGAFATGTQGLIYEPLYLYDPVKGAYDPWLATGAEASGWQGTKYVINVRSGVTWSDGQPMTAADVAFSINLARTNASDPYSANVATVANATASGNTVTVTFKGTPGYTEFTDYLWKAPVLPQHIWSKIPASQIATDANTHPVGTGPMTLDTANTQEVAYQTKADWWGTSALGLSFKFKYLVDVVNGSNSQELGQLNSGNIDWSNNYLPGINMLASAQGGNGGYTLKFYYPKTPYMLSGNTVWLEPNTTKAPMSNVNFRKALAYALNPSAIAQAVYGGIASPSTPTGLLPTLNSAGFVDQAVEKQYGATYNPSMAKSLLAKSGYTGQTLTLEAPQGWSDWNTAQQVIQQELAAVGIKIQVTMPVGEPAHRRHHQRQLRPRARQQRWPGLLSVVLLPARLPAPDPEGAVRPAQLGAVQLAGRLEPGPAGGQHPADQQRPAEPDLLLAGEGLPAAAAGNPALVQRHLVPGQHPVLVELPVKHGRRPEHPGHVDRLHRRHDHGPGPGPAGADPAKTS